MHQFAEAKFYILIAFLKTRIGDKPCVVIKAVEIRKNHATKSMYFLPLNWQLAYN